MDQMKSYKELLTRIEELVSKIENAELTLDELFEMERLTAKLHERSIILRYKAFENKLGLTKAEVIQEEVIEEKIEVIEKKEEPVQEESIPEVEEMEFSLLDEQEEDEDELFSLDADEDIESVPEPVENEAKIEEKPEESQPKVEPELASPKTIGGSFFDQFIKEDNSLGHRFEESKLETLIGAFGLNEKLRYINDLFDGSSELFSDAIKALDNKSSFQDASTLISELAQEHAWDPEEESVTEFMIYIKRRYA